jgi:hypothetical protein
LAPESPPARVMQEASMGRIVPPIPQFNKDELIQPCDLTRREGETARKSRSAEHPVSGDRHFWEVSFTAKRRKAAEIRGKAIAREAHRQSF